MRSHGWLEQDNVIVDITADYFNEGVGKIFVSENKKWHYETWTNHESRIADFRNIPESKRNLSEYFQIIVSITNSTK